MWCQVHAYYFEQAMHLQEQVYSSSCTSLLEVQLPLGYDQQTKTNTVSPEYQFLHSTHTSLQSPRERQGTVTQPVDNMSCKHLSIRLNKDMIHRLHVPSFPTEPESPGTACRLTSFPPMPLQSEQMISLCTASLVVLPLYRSSRVTWRGRKLTSCCSALWQVRTVRTHHL